VLGNQIKLQNWCT